MVVILKQSYEFIVIAMLDSKPIEMIVVWKGSKQCTTAQHATEAEYIAASEAAKEAVWIRKFIDELGVVPSNDYPIKMNCDNSAAIIMAKESGIQKGARHFKRKYHYVRECIETGEIDIVKVHTDDNLADPFTKALAGPKLTRHARSMGLRPASSFISHISPFPWQLKARKYKNRVESICDESGNRFERDQVAGQFMKHFEEFLGSAKPVVPLNTDIFKNTLSLEEAEDMVREEVIGEEFCLAVKEFFRCGKLLSEINVTLIALIPKNIAGSKDFGYHFGCKELKLSHICFADDLLYIEDVKKELLQILPFKRGKLPVRYLGVPLLAKRLSVQDWEFGVSFGMISREFKWAFWKVHFSEGYHMMLDLFDAKISEDDINEKIDDMANEMLRDKALFLYKNQAWLDM
ncbi:hypothetical protein Tco_0267743 [Tanacetum coccineum]